jgi:hypothetical protein
MLVPFKEHATDVQPAKSGKELFRESLPSFVLPPNHVSTDVVQLLAKLKMTA